MTQSPSALIDDSWFDEDTDRDDPVETVLSRSDLPPVESIFPETIPLPLPSSYSEQRYQGQLAGIAQCELELRIGQANDALHELRVAIAHRSFIFRSRVRKNAPTTGYSERLRSYGDAHAIRMTIDHAAKVYSTCRKAMITLGASSTILDKYKVLRKEDLAASTAVVDPNARGQSQAELSWIWQTSTQSSSTPEFMEESRYSLLSTTFCALIYLQCCVSIGCAPRLDVIDGKKRKFCSNPRCNGPGTILSTPRKRGLIGPRIQRWVLSVTPCGRHTIGAVSHTSRRRRLRQWTMRNIRCFSLLFVFICIQRI